MQASMTGFENQNTTTKWRDKSIDEQRTDIISTKTPFKDSCADQIKQFYLLG